MASPCWKSTPTLSSRGTRAASRGASPRASLAQDPSDAGAQAVARKLANFYNSQSKLYAGYRLPEMAPLEQYEAVAFSAPAWALLKVLGDPKAAQYESDVKRLRAYGGLAKGYYGDTTLLLAGLQLTKPAWMKK